MRATIEKILEYAVCAPSGDNSQPWKFGISGNVVNLYNIPGHDNPVLNFKNSGSHIAHGALLENIRIAAPHLGCRADIALFPNATDEHTIATITFTEDTSQPKDPLFAFIRERHTNRHPYRNTPLTKTECDSLTSAGNARGLGIVKLTDRDENTKKAARAGALAEKVILENEILHALLFKDVVWSEKDEKKRCHGLFIDTMEFTSPQKLIFWLARKWSFMKIAIRLGLPTFIANEDSKLYSSGGVLGIVAFAADTKENAVHAGGVFQRVWLEATHLGFALQPITATLFFARKIRANDAQDINLFHQESMLKAEADIRAAFGTNEEILYMMFRVGHAPKASARSSRIAIREKIVA